MSKLAFSIIYGSSISRDPALLCWIRVKYASGRAVKLRP